MSATTRSDEGRHEARAAGLLFALAGILGPIGGDIGGWWRVTGVLIGLGAGALWMLGPIALRKPFRTRRSRRFALGFDAVVIAAGASQTINAAGEGRMLGAFGYALGAFAWLLIFQTERAAPVRSTEPV